jgi:hypothetical protein
MSLAILEIGYKQVKKLLKESNLLLEENYSKDLNFSSSKFSSDFFEVCQGNNYRKIHEIALINKDYDFLLKDYSFWLNRCFGEVSQRKKLLILYRNL